MSKRHTIYVLVDEEGRFVDAFLSYSEAVLMQRSGQAIRTIYDREDY